MNQQTLVAIKSIVERARLGDQNAMGIIVETRKNAARGNPKSKESLAAFEEYVRANPVQERIVDFGTETSVGISILSDVGPLVGLPILLELPKAGSDALLTASVILANQHQLMRDRIFEIASALPTAEEKDTFVYAVENSHRGIGDESSDMDIPLKKVFYAGLCIGLARNIQQVRTPRGNVSRFSPMAGWELGEQS